MSTDDQLDTLLVALAREGFELPYMARSQDYFPEGQPHPDAREQDEAVAALRAADAEADRRNRDALRRALASAGQ